MKTLQQVSNSFALLLCILSVKITSAQNVGISSSSSFAPDASAALDVSFTNKGLLIPRVALTATNAAGPVTSPATSLLVYNTATAGTAPNNVVPGYYYYSGTAWVALSTSANGWSTIGNAGTTAGTNFLGTTDLTDLVMKTNNVERARITSAGTGNLAGNFVVSSTGSTTVNSSNPEKLLVDAGNTSSFNVITGKGNFNNYLQLNIQNNNAGTTASSDVVASADNASETANFVDMGINSSANNTTGVLGGANTAYLYGMGNDFAIGNGTSGKNLLFFTGGTATNERMRIDGTGNVGINNIGPTEKLDITGNLKFSGALMPNNNAGTAGYFLASSGAGAAPTWANANNFSWTTTGNSATTPGTNFIGTTDAQDFVMKTSNTERARISSLGDFGIGTTTFNSTNPEQLLVDAGTENSFNVISGKGNLNNYLQLNIQNNSAGASASSDVVASADNASETANFVDMGINSSANNTTGVLGGANTAYLYGMGNDFAIGNGTLGKNLLFFTGGTATNERMRINGTGNIGIGTTTPTQPLDVNGNISVANAVYIDAANTNAGTKTPGLIFGGPSSGETISSKRTTGGNQYGMDFYTSSTSRMSILAGGNVGIGTTTPAFKLAVAGIVAPSTDNAYTLGASGNRWTVLYATNGTINTSDRRLKTNIKPLNYGLKEVLALQPVSYNWKDTAHPENKIGLIAQDVRKLIPEVVIGDEAKEKLGMNYAEIVPVLINAIKEQQKQIDQLKQLVEASQKAKVLQLLHTGKPE